jgi:GNAT superfamily N-acetyltransferase
MKREMDMELICLRADEHAERPALAQERDRLNYPVWGPPLSEAGYLAREQRLWRHPFARAGMRVWLLMEGGRPVASCESYAVPAACRGVTGTGHGIASVFVEEALRGRGHAAALLGRVHATLRAEGALCAYLISEIGPRLYEGLGYIGRPLRCRRFIAPRPGEPEPGLDQVRWLLPADVPGLLAARYPASPSPSPLVLRLSAAQLDWHVERGRIYAEALGRQAPQRVGAACGGAFCLWMHDLRKELLRVLLLYPGPEIFAAGSQDPRSPQAAALRNVLHAARAEAAHCGLRGVEIWENAINAGWLRGGQPAASEDLPMVLALDRRVNGNDWLDWERGHWL